MTFVKFFAGNPFLLIAVAAGVVYLAAGARRRGRLRVLAFNVIVIGTLCGVLDTVLALRAAPEFRVENPDYHHGLKPHVDSSEEWGEDSYTFFSNSLGMRDREPRDVALDSGARRVVLLGDSFVEGIGVDYDDTFAGILEERLRPSGVEVLNPSVISYSPKLYLHKMKYWFERGLDVDELWVFVDLSDTQDEIVYESWSPVASGGGQASYALRSYWYKGSSVARWIIDTLSPNGMDSDLWGGSEKYYVVRDRWTVSNEDFRAWGEKGLALAEKHMDELHSICRERGVTMVVAVYPWPQQIQRREARSIQVTFWREFAERRGLDFLDLFPSFIRADEAPGAVLRQFFFEKDIHWNEAGHQRMAEAILEYGIPRQPKP